MRHAVCHVSQIGLGEPFVRHGVCNVRQIGLGRNKFMIKEVRYVSDVYIVLVN